MSTYLRLDIVGDKDEGIHITPDRMVCGCVVEVWSGAQCNVGDQRNNEVL